MEVFHELPLKLYFMKCSEKKRFTVYPCLKNSKKYEKEAGTNFPLLSRSRHMIG